ncbi:Bug family tripartite tricarboxylate transporter substrate binding protein [Variovorax sp. 38R]|uniref:Bug family tripartite tricarboxylate transporter substrate binding protein n=1 Tax=Variovorax sp. 38R TaxID=2774875 RepID=UPI001786CF96|nr:tripartite tricarboxylate transporter substrate binding protein [Variovorax sp. 38R]QOF77852.1 tripartite tricarboxylate transporter substrate binding protein [Variovorax sp. 38R]
MHRSRLTRHHALALAAALATGSAFAQQQATTWPDKPIRMIVPYAAGGGTDVFARIVAEGLGKRLGQSVIVDNRPGGNGQIGITAVQRAPADGYTVLFSLTSIIQNPLLYPNAGFDPFKDFVPVSEAGRLPIVFTVSNKLGVDTLDGFVKLARAAPGKYSYGSYGNGSSAHLYAEVLQDAAGIQLLHVPYKGEAPAITDLLGGTVDAVFVSAKGVGPHVAAGKVKSIAVVGTARAPLAAGVPTFKEQGFAGMESVGWFGIYLPAGTPQPIAQRLSTEVAQVVQSPEQAARIEGLGVIPVGSTPAQLTATMRADHARWKQVIQAKNIKLD